MPLGVSTNVGAQAIGTPPIGVLSPGWQPIHNLIYGMRLNLIAEPWTEEVLYHRATGALPNPAPIGLSFQASRIPTTTLRRPYVPVPPNPPKFGKRVAGVGG